MKRTKLAILALALALVMAMPTMVTANQAAENPQEAGLMPIRAFFEDLGSIVDWQGEDRSIHIAMDGGNIILFAEQTAAYVNGNAITLQDAVVLWQSTSFITEDDLILLYDTLAAAMIAEALTGISEGGVIHGAIHRIEYGYNVAYLFGTIHGGHDHWFPLADVVEDALRRADVLVLEVENIGGYMSGLEEALMEVMFLADGNTWADVLPDTEYNHLVAMMVEWDIAYEEVNTMNPAFLAFSLEMELAQLLADFEVGLGVSVDAYVEAIAVELGLPVIGMETAAQQLDILHNPPFEVMLAQIMNLQPPVEMIERLLGSDELSLDELAALYENNDIVGLQHAFSLEMGADTDCLHAIYVREAVMNGRSVFYANEIIRMLRETEEPTIFFVAVGLSHIVRSGGGEEFTDIVQQMRLQGIVAVPIWN